MKKNNIPVYLCELPPPYGGVTVKNRLIRDSVFTAKDVEIIDFFDCKRNVFNIFIVFIKMISAFMNHRTIIYGFGDHSRMEIAVLLQCIFGGKESLTNTINIVMGGIFQDYICGKKSFIKSLVQMKMHYVETQGMVDKLKKQGIENVRIFPNARSIKGSIPPKNDTENKTFLNCVFFSQISTQKGVREIIKMYESLNDEEKEHIYIDFYGHILDEIKKDFKIFVKENRNIKYCDIYDAVHDDVYSKLSEYDVLLFPTLWETEGVPGIVVEAKMAGIVPIVSDRSFNTEIVKNGIEGIVIYKEYSNALKEAVQLLFNDRKFLNVLKDGSFQSRVYYSMETYVDELKKTICKKI